MGNAYSPKASPSTSDALSALVRDASEASLEVQDGRESRV